MLSRHLVRVIQFLVGASLIALLFLWGDHGAHAIELILTSSPRAILAIIALSLLMNWVSATKWYLFTRARGTGVSLRQLTALYLIGKFFSNFVPGMIGGDVTRSILLGRHVGSQSIAAASIFLERFTGILALTGLAVIAASTQPNILGSRLIGAAVAAASFGCLSILAILLVPRLRQLLSQIAQRIFGARQILSAASSVFTELEFFRRHYAVLFATIGLSLLFYGLASVSMYLTCRTVGLMTTYPDVAHATPVIYLATSIPVTPSNMGWWEWCVGLLVAPSEEQLANGIAAGLLIRAVTLAVSLLGGLLFLGYRIHNPAQQPDERADRGTHRE